MKILAIAAHPDDEVLGCGATLAKHALAGDEVSILVLGSGATARNETPAFTREAAALGDACYASARIIGATAKLDVLPDNRFDSLDLLDIIKRIESVVSRVQPDVVYTHHGRDRNVDHRRTCDAVLTACRPIQGSSVKRILSFEIPSSTEWGEGFEPNVFVDVTGEPMLRKLRSLDEYKSEMRQFPHPRSEEAIKALAAWRGATSGVKEAEAFCLLRSIE